MTLLMTNGDRSLEKPVNTGSSNGDRGTRTPDLYVANVSLSQLSYIPIAFIIALLSKECKEKIEETLFC